MRTHAAAYMQLWFKDRMYVWDLILYEAPPVFVCFSVKTSSSLSRTHAHACVCACVCAATSLPFWILKGAAPFAQFFPPKTAGDLTSAPDPLPTGTAHYALRAAHLKADISHAIWTPPLKLRKRLTARILTRCVAAAK